MRESDHLSAKALLVIMMSTHFKTLSKMISSLVVIASLLLFIHFDRAAAAAASPLLEVDDRAVVSEADLIYLSPASDPLEGQPIGNGHMGRLVCKRRA